MKRLASFPFFFLLALAGYGQTANPCRELLEAYAQKIGAYGLPGARERYRLHLDVTAVPAKRSVYTPASLEGKTVDLKMTITGKELFYESTYLAVYRDEKDVFTVIHPQRTIVHSRPEQLPEAQGQDVLSRQLAALQQGFIKRSRVTACRDTVYAGQAAKVMELLPDPQDQAQYHIKRITNYVLTGSLTVPRQVIEYAEGHGLARQVVNYHALDLDYKGKQPKSARACVYAAPGKLLDKYQGYQVEEE
jgi:hypothetical protein